MPCFDFGDNLTAETPKELGRYHFDYIKPNERTQLYIENCRRVYKDVLEDLHGIRPSRERSIAITKLEESLMFATKAIVVASKNSGVVPSNDCGDLPSDPKGE